MQQAPDSQSSPQTGSHANSVSRATTGFGVAVLAVAAATGIRYLIGPLVGSDAPFSIYYVAVVIAAWYGGLLPAFMAILAGALLGAWLFIPPVDEMKVTSPQDLWGLALYVFAGAAIGLFSGAARRAQRRALELAAHDLERQTNLDRVLNRMADGFAVFDRQWRYVYINDRILELTRMTREQLLGHNVWDLFPDRVGGVGYSAMIAAMQEQRPSTFETHFSPSNTWLECRVYPSPEGVTIYVTDATERKSALQSREGVERLNRAILDAALDGIITIDEQGAIESFNPAAERLFGYRASEVIGRKIGMLMPDPYRSQQEEYLERYRRTGERRIIGFGREVEGLRKDGTTFPLDLSVSELQIAGRRIFTGLIHDVSERKQVDRHRERMLANERSARSAAEEANRAKDEFLATLSHELRTPLNAVLGWAQLLRTGAVGAEELAHGLETIERHARLQTQLIEDLLDMSRITSGRMRLDVRRVELAELANSALETVAPAAGVKQIRVERSQGNGDMGVSGDPARLQQIVWNLLSNAIKFTPQGGWVRVGLDRDGDHVRLSVSDSGIGLKPEFVTKLFQRFSQADTSTTRRFGGLGLGLAIVRHLVELHGGTVAASSAGDNCGSTFTVSLPAADAPAPARSARPAGAGDVSRHGGSSDVTLKGIKVLIVDDEADTRMLMQRFLRQFDAEVGAVASVAEAVQRVQSDPPHVLVSDIGMPDEDGYSLIRRIRELSPEQGGRIPAVALTAFARPEDQTRALGAGFQAHLAKPVEPMELIAIVAALSKSGSGRP